VDEMNTVVEVEAKEFAQPADLTDQPPPTQETEGPRKTQPLQNEVENESTQAPQLVNQSEAPTPTTLVNVQS